MTQASCPKCGEHTRVARRDSSARCLCVSSLVPKNKSSSLLLCTGSQNILLEDAYSAEVCANCGAVVNEDVPRAVVSARAGYKIRGTKALPPQSTVFLGYLHPLGVQYTIPCLRDCRHTATAPTTRLGAALLCQSTTTAQRAPAEASYSSRCVHRFQLNPVEASGPAQLFCRAPPCCGKKCQHVLFL